jgi:predicted amidohydrolase YtcJ
VALLDRDIFAGEPAAIAEASVLATWVGAEQVFDR